MSERDVLLNKLIWNFESIDGESELLLITDFYHNGYPGYDNQIYTQQELVLQGKGISATFDLCGIPITPERLRALADLLEKEVEQAKVNKIKFDNIRTE